jgi:hypothetical protein
MIDDASKDDVLTLRAQHQPTRRKETYKWKLL